MIRDIAQRLQEAILAEVLSAPTPLRSRYAIDGHPPMWSLLHQSDGTTMAVRPAMATQRDIHGFSEVPGLAVGWHKGGEWTDKQNEKMSWEYFVQKRLLPAFASGACFVKNIGFSFTEAESLEITAIRLQGMGNVTAQAHSDDHRVEVAIDARPYLARATDQELAELQAIDWRGDYAADAVYHAACAQEDAQATKLERYLSRRPLMPNGDTVGFEVVCEAQDMIDWLHDHRPIAHANLLATKYLADHGMPKRGVLDDLLHEFMSEIAVIINRAGAREQEDYLRMAGVDSERVSDLSIAVLDTAAAAADEANAKGPDAQLRFLIGEDCAPERIAQWVSTVEAGPAP